MKSIHWPTVVLITLALSILHEAERVSVSWAVTAVRKRSRRNRGELIDFGQVIVKGNDQAPRPEQESSDEEEDECLICSGVGVDSPMSQSITSISSSTPADQPSLGPLEAFCTIAPQKHLAHRECFLAWHSAYRQQRSHASPELVTLTRNSEATSPMGETERSRARAILSSAGFHHLAGMLRLPTDAHIWIADARGFRRWNSSSVDAPTFSLSSPGGTSAIPVPGIGDTHTTLGTLTTHSPPCPGCRSAVKLWFIGMPAIAKTAASSRSTAPYVRLLRTWLHAWSTLVTGRTLLLKMTTQLLFVLALVSVARVRNTRRRYAGVVL